MTPQRNGPGAAGTAPSAGDPQLDTRLATVRQAATGGPCPRAVVVICRIVRPAPQNIWTAAAGPGARCVACPAELARVPPAVAVVEAPAAGICLVAGICTRCAARRDRDLIPAAYAALCALAPSLRPLGPGGPS
jgi:hypothetical protein